MMSSGFAHSVEVIGEKSGESFAGCGDVATWDGESMEVFCDDVLPGAGVGGEDGTAAGHGFEDGEAEALVAGEGGDEGHALEESGEFGRGSVTVKNDAGSESGGGDFYFQLGLVVAKFWGGFTHDDDRGSGVFLKEGNGGVDEDVDAFLGANAAEDADAKFARKAELFPRGLFVGRQLVAIEIDPVGDHDVGPFFEVGFCSRASGDDGVHLPHEPAGKAGVVTLGGRGEDDFEFCSELPGGESLDHFIVSPGVEEAGVTIFEGDEFAEGESRGAFGEVVLPHHGERHLLLHVREGLQHGGGDAGEALIRVAKNETGDGHSIDGSRIVGSGCKAESDGADEKEVTGQKFEVALDGLRNVGVVVGPQGGLPKVRRAKKTRENVDQHEG